MGIAHMRMGTYQLDRFHHLSVAFCDQNWDGEPCSVKGLEEVAAMGHPSSVLSLHKMQAHWTQH